MAYTYREIRNVSAFRLHPGGHSFGPDWQMTEGILWLEWQYQKDQQGPVREEFEERLLEWIHGLIEPHPDRALHWSRLLLETGADRRHHDYLNRLKAHLEQDKTNALYDDGLKEIEDLARRIMAPAYRSSEHLRDVLQLLTRRVENIEETYRASPWISELLENLKLPTVDP